MIIIVTKTHTKNNGFIFGSCSEFEGEDILIPSAGHIGSNRDFHQLKKGSFVEGFVQKTDEGRLRLQKYRIVSGNNNE